MKLSEPEIWRLLPGEDFRILGFVRFHNGLALRFYD